MQSKTGNLMMALGAVIAVIGLIVIPAGLGQDSSDKNLVGVGAAVFSMGALLAAMGIYLKSKMSQSTGPKIIEAAAANRPIRGGCDRCQKEAPVIHCKVHQQHLCGACLAEHYDFRSCVYAPSARRDAAVKSMAARAR
ncbi:MAG TPA: hypothetical protein VLK33_10015 [Terriglobales bacterium]|nr:hypothetical protein [Terriglobales bacterium]